MTDRGLFTVTDEGFEPHDDRALELHRRLRSTARASRPVFLTVRSPRNPEFNALAHVVFHKLADGLGVPMEAVKAFLKEQTGRFDVVKMPDGSFVKLRKSVSFESMSEEQFRAFWNDCLPVILERLLGGVKSSTYQEIVDILAGKPR